MELGGLVGMEGDAWLDAVEWTRVEGELEKGRGV